MSPILQFQNRVEQIIEGFEACYELFILDLRLESNWRSCNRD